MSIELLTIVMFGSLFFLLGLSVVIMAVLIEGAIQLFRSLTHGRTRADHR